MRYLFIFILILMQTACSKEEKKAQSQETKPQKEIIKKENLPTAIIHKKIVMLKDAEQSYAVYLPKSYDISKSNPLIFIFDPTAKGKESVERLIPVAEKYGYILVGSNVSRNGMAKDAMNKHLEMLFEDVNARFSIDPKRIYTCGFSGGGRVAGEFAIKSGKICGVVSCAAGISSTVATNNQPFDFIGIIGETDFNFLELMNTQTNISKQPGNHCLLLFPGKHEWSPIPYLEKAFDYMQLYAMKRSLIPNDKEFIESSYKSYKSKINRANLLEEFDNLSNISSLFSGLRNIDDDLQRMKEINETEKYKQLVSDKNALRKKEAKVTQELMQALSKNDLTWWQSEIQKIYTGIKTSKDSETKNFYKRQLSFLSIGSYMYTGSAIEQKIYDKAEDFIAIYKLVDPENSDYNILKAMLHISRNEPQYAIDELKKWLKHGKPDIEKLRDKSFDPIRNTAEFNEIYNSLIEKEETK